MKYFQNLETKKKILNRFQKNGDDTYYKCNKYRQLKNPEIYIFDKTLITSDNCGRGKTIFKEKESIEILKILDLNNNIEQHQMNT